MLVSWYFEPSQPQRITSGLKTMFSLFPIYSAHKSSNHKLFINHKISPDENVQKHTERRLEEQSEKAESCRENLWNEIQLKGP